MRIATTRYGSLKIPIYAVPRREIEATGCTHWRHGKCDIALAADILNKPDRVRSVLLHEFIHVVEYLNDPAYLSPVTIDECTLLAQTMEVGLGQLLNNLRPDPEFARQLSATAQPRAKRPRRKAPRRKAA